MPQRRHNPLSHLWWFAMPIATLALLLVWGPSLFGMARLYMAQYGGDVYAFYIDSGHTFYGTIQGVGFGTVTLSNVYSFQTVQVGDTPTSNLTAQQLNPITAPLNWITLNWKHVLFYERVGPNAKVLKIMHGNQ